MRKNLFIAAAVLLCVVALGALRFTLLGDGSRSLPRPSMEDMAKRFHPGEGPCLRYAAEDSVPDEALARVSDSFARLGLSSRETGDLAGAFMRWGAERESSLHASDEAEEWTEALSERGSLTVRVGLWYRENDVRRALAAANERYFAEGTAALERLSPEQREEVRALWESRPEALTIPNMLKVLPLLRKEESRARLAEVARVLKERAVVGEALAPERIEALTGLEPEAFLDGWGNRFTYDTTLPGGVRLIALGRDGELGGTDEDADLIHDVVLDPAAAKPAAAVAGLPCAPPPAEVVISRAEYEAVVECTSAVCPQPRVVPAFVDGKAVGFKVFAIQPDSGLARLGLCNGDVVTAVAGIPLTTPEQALEAYIRVKGAREIPFHFQRRGEEFDVRVRIQ